MENAAWNGNHAAIHGFLLEAAQDRNGRHYWKVCLTEHGRHHCLESGYENNLAAALRRSPRRRQGAAIRRSRRLGIDSQPERLPPALTPRRRRPAINSGNRYSPRRLTHARQPRRRATPLSRLL